MRFRALLLFSLLFVASFTGARAGDGPMSFKVVRSGNCASNCIDYILADGLILPNSYLGYLEVTRTLRRPLPVYLRSPGGFVAGGILLGAAFRLKGAAVSVAPGGECSSACAYAFIGGSRRSVPQGARLGVHRSTTLHIRGSRVVGFDTAKNAQATGTLRQYMTSMGVDPNLADFTANVDPSTMHYLNRQQLSRYRVTTGGGGGERSAGLARQAASTSRAAQPSARAASRPSGPRIR